MPKKILFLYIKLLSNPNQTDSMICDLTLDSRLCNQLLKRMSKAEYISLANVSFLTVGSGALSKLARYSKILSLK